MAARLMLGETLAQVGTIERLDLPFFSIKAPVFPFNKFQGVDTLLGPEMKSTGEVMGIDADFGSAFAKSQLAAYGGLPERGTVFVSVANRDKRAMIFPVRALAELGFTLVATSGTADVLRRNGITAEVLRHITDLPLIQT